LEARESTLEAKILRWVRLGKVEHDEERMTMETQSPLNIENKDETSTIHRLEPLSHPMDINNAKT
jgi:hypothetical protein